jgi:hypothetical protein
VGVAVDDGTVDDLVARARESIEGTGEKLDQEVFDRVAARLSYVSGDFTDPSMYARLGAAISGARTPVFDLEIPPFVFGTVVKGLADAGLTDGARVVVEKPFGHDIGLGAGACRGPAPVHRRVAAPSDRPLPRKDGSRGDPLSRLREHDARAGLEPELRRVRADNPASAFLSRKRKFASSSSTRLVSGSRRSSGDRSPTSWAIKLDPSTGVQIVLDAHRADVGRAAPVTFDIEFAQMGGCERCCASR